jgi:fructose/tagatose bisphosphate aldolase
MDATYPFTDDGQFRPLDERITFLASNVNFDVEVQMRGFAQASAAFDGSPQIIQVSYTAADQTGANPKKLPPIEGVERNPDTRPAAVGAMRAGQILEWAAEDYQADLLWMSLDHFTSPKFSVADYAGAKGCGGIYEPVAKALLEDAIETIGLSPSQEEFAAYLNYLTSDAFGEYARDFFGAVALSGAAWVMIDTGDTPAAVNLASSKWLVDGVRTGLDLQDVIIEAEFSATGSSGEEEAYPYWQSEFTPDGLPTMTDEAQEAFLKHITTFVKVTDADAIAYEVGSKHAAKAGEQFKIDVGKLQATQSALRNLMGRCIAYAGHGGTGFKWEDNLIGPVFKRNINTQHLYAGTMSQVEWIDKHRAGIENREKNAIGRGRKIAEVNAAAESAIELLKSCRSWQAGPQIRDILSGVEAKQVEFQDSNATE